MFRVLIILLILVYSCDEDNPVIPDTTPPTISIQSPVSGETVTENVIISVFTQDNVELILPIQILGLYFLESLF